MHRLLKTITVGLVLWASGGLAQESQVTLDDFISEPDYSETLDQAGSIATCFGLAQITGWEQKAELLAARSIEHFMHAKKSEDEAIRFLYLYGKVASATVDGYTMGQSVGIRKVSGALNAGDREREIMRKNWELTNTEEWNAMELYKSYACDSLIGLESE